MPLSRLVPEAPRPAHELLAEVRATERAPDDRPFVFVNMVATADGRAALDGRTEDLGAEADLELLLELRAIADAVLVGTGTLRAEGYARLVGSPERRARRRAAGLAEDPLAVVISRRFDIPWEAGLFQAPEQPVLVYTGSRRRRAAGHARAGRGRAPRRPDARRGARRPARPRHPRAPLRGRPDAAARARRRRARSTSCS